MSTKANTAQRKASGAKLKPDFMLSMRVPGDLLQRGDDLVERVAADAELAAVMGRVSRSAILRLALFQGMKVLERRYRR